MLPPTICSSDNRVFLLAPSLSAGAAFSRFSWSEKAEQVTGSTMKPRECQRLPVEAVTFPGYRPIP